MSALKLQFLIECVDGATKKVRDIQATVDKATKPVRDLGEGFANVKAKIVDLANEGGMQRVSAAWDNFADKVKALPMIAAISLAGVVAAVARTEQQLEQAVRTAMKIGMPTAQFQQMSFAAKQAGLGPEELAHGMQHLARKMVEAKQGSKETMAWFKLVGVNARDLKTAKPYDVMMKIADTFARVGDAGQNAMLKTALLTGLMSRSGPELKGFFDQGGAGIKTFMDQAQKMGVGLNETEAKGVITFAQSVGRLTASMDVMMVRIVTRLNPALEKLIDQITGKNVKNGDTIVRVVGDALSALLAAMPKMLIAFGGMTKGVVMLFEALDKIASFLGGWTVIFGVFAAVLAGKATMAMVGLAQAAWGLGVAMLATPFGWVLAGLAAVAVISLKVYQHWDSLVQKLHELRDAMPQWALQAFEWQAKLLGIQGMQPRAQGSWAEAGATGSWGDPVARKDKAVAFGGAAGAFGQQQLGGTLDIKIDANGLVQALMKKAPGGIMDFNLDTGPTLSTR